MGVDVPLLAAPQTWVSTRRVLVGGAVLRGALGVMAVVLLPWLYREHAATLVLLRPTKEVFLFEGFLIRDGKVFLPVVVIAALPLLLAGVWVFFAIGRAYADDLADKELPG